jgi:uncharacterized protein (TIGR03000 family)
MDKVEELLKKVQELQNKLNQIQDQKGKAQPGTPPGTPPGGFTPPPPAEAKPNLLSRALIKVEVPADAHLYLDGNITGAEGKVRAIRTPPLVPGESYFYELRVEVIREGKSISQTRRVAFRAGEEAQVTFALPNDPAPVAAATKSD